MLQYDLKSTEQRRTHETEFKRRTLKGNLQDIEVGERSSSILSETAQAEDEY